MYRINEIFHNENKCNLKKKPSILSFLNLLIVVIFFFQLKYVISEFQHCNQNVNTKRAVIIVLIYMKIVWEKINISKTEKTVSIMISELKEFGTG